MAKIKSKIVTLNSLSSHFFVLFNTPVIMIIGYLLLYQPTGYIPAIYLMVGLWLVFMLIINKITMLRNSVIIEPWISAILHLGLKTRIVKKHINSVKYLPGGKWSGEMMIKYKDNKEVYIGMTENGERDLRTLRRTFD